MAKNETVPSKGMKAGNDFAALVPTKIDFLPEGFKAAKGIWLKNLDSTDAIFISTGDATVSNYSYTLIPLAEVFIPIEDPQSLWVFASANAPEFTWFSV